MTTLTTQDLREYLVGAWTLESYESSDVDGSNVRYPLGTDARGLIMYTADGYMSAQLMRADRPPIARGDLQIATDDELAAAARGYLAYARSTAQRKSAMTACSSARPSPCSSRASSATDA